MNSFWRVIDLPSWVVCLVLLTLLSIKGIGSSWTKGFSVDHVLMFEPYPWHKLLVLQSRIVNKMCRAQNLVTVRLCFAAGMHCMREGTKAQQCEADGW